MLAGLNNQGGGGATCEAYWREMPSAFKCLVVSTLVLGLFGIFSNLFIFIFADIVIYTVNKFQIWRVLTSFLVDRSIISVIFNLYIINMSFPVIVCSRPRRKKCTLPPTLSSKSSFKLSSAILSLSCWVRFLPS